jgi:hypothetical protein
MEAHALRLLHRRAPAPGGVGAKWSRRCMSRLSEHRDHARLTAVTTRLRHDLAVSGRTCHSAHARAARWCAAGASRALRRTTRGSGAGEVREAVMVLFDCSDLWSRRYCILRDAVLLSARSVERDALCVAAHGSRHPWSTWIRCVMRCCISGTRQHE